MKGSEGTLEMEMWSSLTASVAKNTKSFGEFWFLSPSLCIFHRIKKTFSDFEEKSGRRRIFMADHGCHPSRAPWWAQPWQWGPLGRTLAPPPFFRGTFI